MPTVMTQQQIDRQFMQQAIEQAHFALDKDEVPVGAVIVKNNEIIAVAYNTVIANSCSTAHAEINAINQACQSVDNYRLLDCTLYVTLEPCVMCAGAILHARLKRLVFGCFDQRFGAAGSCLNVLQSDWFNHQCQIETGVLSKECSALLQDFFKNKRNL